MPEKESGTCIRWGHIQAVWASLGVPSRGIMHWSDRQDDENLRV